jgi:hypothetical protein
MLHRALHSTKINSKGCNAAASPLKGDKGLEELGVSHGW